MATIRLDTLKTIIDEIARDLNRDKENEGEKEDKEITEKDFDKMVDFVKKNMFNNVVSESCSDFYHKVDLENNSCTCPDFVYNKSGRGMDCKHLKKSKKWRVDYEKNFYPMEL